jgi:hypothetical protein
MTRRASILLLAAIFSTAVKAELKVYDVGAEYRQEIFEALQGVFSPRHAPATGHVEMLPTGQILVETAPDRQAEVAAVLEAIDQRRADAAPRITLRYWAVLGNRAATEAADTPEILADVLADLERVHGDLAFRVLGNATLVTESGQSGSLSGQPLSVRQQTYVQGSLLNAELSISFSYRYLSGAWSGAEQPNAFQTLAEERQSLMLKTAMRPGEFVVVGENTINADTLNGELRGTIFYIVQWADAG